MPDWYLTKDGDVSCLAMMSIIIQPIIINDGHKRRLFCGPGEKIVPRTRTTDALFVWRKFIDASGQTGIDCAAFRNESAIRSSEFIRQADAVAFHVWPGLRHYTYVNAKKVRSVHPRFCFVAVGWRKSGATKGGLLV